MTTRLAGLEGLRGAAALLVVGYHMQLVGLSALGATVNGYLAVDLFFVLSGYVVCGAYGDRLSGTTQWRTFIVRRFGRLWPTHIATSALCYAAKNVILAMAMLAHVANVQFFIPPITDILGVALFAQGLNTFDHQVGNGNSWSVSDEFYVYILFSLLCLGIRRRRALAFAAISVTGYALAIVVSIGPSACLAHGHCLDLTYRYGWTRCLAGFFAGALIRQYSDTAAVAALTGRATQASIFAVTLCFVLFADRVPGAALAAPAVFAVLVASLSRDRGPVAWLLKTRGAQLLGRLSYSLYLAHAVLLQVFMIAILSANGPVAHAIEGMLFLLASLGLAHVLYRHVEMPLRDRFYAWADAGARSRAGWAEEAQDGPVPNG
jgi:peptidoglycan/LPS O-acetylase OafA/YrhL